MRVRPWPFPCHYAQRRFISIYIFARISNIVFLLVNHLYDAILQHSSKFDLLDYYLDNLLTENTSV